MAVQKTYTMIKPDGVRNGHIGEIVNRFERAGLAIERMEMGMVTPEQAAANYAEHEGKPFYEGLVSYITSGPVVKMVVSGEGAVAKCRSLMGATNPADAAPGTIRGDFGLVMDENVIHGSDSPRIRRAGDRDILSDGLTAIGKADAAKRSGTESCPLCACARVVLLRQAAQDATARSHSWGANKHWLVRQPRTGAIFGTRTPLADLLRQPASR